LTAPGLLPSAAHLKRLREVWRSAGWPCLDNIELDLLAAGLLTRHWDEAGRQTLRVSDSGIAVLAAKRQRHQQALSAHEELVGRVATEMQRAGRIVWRGLSLRAPLPGDDGHTQWPTVMPDLFSIRNTTLEDCTEAVVHEIKVSRADFRSDLQRPAKGQAYQALASQCWYVLKRGIAQLDEVPAEYGVLWADAHGLEVGRAAPKRAMRLPFMMWMALARAPAVPPLDGDEQAHLK
jgi:hypothetical protein